MSFIVDLIEQYGLMVVFINVFLEQLDAPLPAYPTMLVAGALAYDGAGPLWAPGYRRGGSIAGGFHLVLDWQPLWQAGLGNAVPHFDVARFLRSVDRVGSPALRAGIPAGGEIYSRFCLGSQRAGWNGRHPAQPLMLADGCGAALWAGSAILLGSVFRAAIDDMLAVLEGLRKGSRLLAALVLGCMLPPNGGSVRVS
jgi:hypothetical protein